MANNRVAFIASDDPVLTSTILDTIGIGPEADQTGTGAFILKVGSARTGYWDGNLWEWLGIHE